MPTKSAAKPQRKAPAHAEPTTSDRLKDAVEDLDKARDQAGQQAKETSTAPSPASARPRRSSATRPATRRPNGRPPWRAPATTSCASSAVARARPALARRAQGPVGRDPPSQGGARRLRGPAAGVSVPSAHRLPPAHPMSLPPPRSGSSPPSAARRRWRAHAAARASPRPGSPPSSPSARVPRAGPHRGPRSTSPRGPPTTSRAWRSCGDCSTQAGPGGDVVGVARTARHAARRIAAAAAETVLTGAGRPPMVATTAPTSGSPLTAGSLLPAVGPLLGPPVRRGPLDLVVEAVARHARRTSSSASTPSPGRSRPSTATRR